MYRKAFFTEFTDRALIGKCLPMDPRPACFARGVFAASGNMSARHATQIDQPACLPTCLSAYKHAHDCVWRLTCSCCAASRPAYLPPLRPRSAARMSFGDTNSGFSHNVGPPNEPAKRRMGFRTCARGWATQRSAAPMHTHTHNRR
jgi:hypothetical protein|eukprot:COSAG01_NODE_4529_length_4949_cov_224.324124_3_plen_146_part_00